jgi:hypothetical protein
VSAATVRRRDADLSDGAEVARQPMKHDRWLQPGEYYDVEATSSRELS